jgi:hypothetical protein
MKAESSRSIEREKILRIRKVQGERTGLSDVFLL